MQCSPLPCALEFLFLLSTLLLLAVAIVGFFIKDLIKFYFFHCFAAKRYVLGRLCLGSCPINVKVVTDPKHSAGKAITSDLIQQLLQKVTDGDSNAIPVLFTDRDAQMQGLCFTKCSNAWNFW
ncbi:hypothetical protein NC651_039922 [Populus alba x Populus x berolinensis]|nr:hypothetical protein NC651_039922 [Populus alba x Populus x berolinensis]